MSSKIKMNTIFNALDLTNNNDNDDCCNGDEQCKEQKLIDKCIPVSSSVVAKNPELSCEIPKEIRTKIINALFINKNIINDNYTKFLLAIRSGDYDPIIAILPPYCNITIASIARGIILFTNLPFPPSINELTRLLASSVPAANGVVVVSSTTSSTPSLNTFKKTQKNVSNAKIVPHAEQSFTTTTTATILATEVVTTSQSMTTTDVDQITIFISTTL
jgi:hypothetical protein